jgi:hypothetical protein
VDAVVKLTNRDPRRLPETAENLELLQLRGIEDKPGLQMHLHAIVECLFGLASGFFMLLSEDIGVGSVDGQFSDNLFPRGLIALREIAPIELEGLFNGLGTFLFGFLDLKFCSIQGLTSFQRYWCGEC